MNVGRGESRETIPTSIVPVTVAEDPTAVSRRSALNAYLGTCRQSINDISQVFLSDQDTRTDCHVIDELTVYPAQSYTLFFLDGILSPHSRTCLFALRP